MVNLLYPQKEARRRTKTPISQITLDYLQWRKEAADALEAAEFLKEAGLFRACAHHYDVDICVVDVDHAPRAVPHTCSLRFCPECEAREQSHKLARFVPPIHDMMTLGKAGYSLKHIVLTTPYELSDPDAQSLYKNAWRALEKVLDRVFYRVFDGTGELSAAELRRHEVNLKQHGVGILAAAEFGEIGHKLHFHLLAYCPFVPKYMLSEYWNIVTHGDCEVSWIERVDLDQVEKAVLEVAKYVTKFKELPPALVPALAKAIDGSRRLRTYGTMRSLGKPDKPDCSCPICSANRRLIGFRSYLEKCFEAGIAPADSIVDKYESVVFNS